MKAPFALLVAVLLTGCYAAPTSPRFAERTGAERAPAATGTATMQASATRTAVACPAPVGVVSGLVFDQDRMPIKEGARVTVTSLDAEAPFEASVAVMGGAYVISQAPVGARLAVTAVGPSGFPRTRELTISGSASCVEAESLKASLNFGGAASPQDPTANLFYLPR
jgi:hypothetical protein